MVNKARRGYSPLYEANEDAHNLPFEQLKGLIAQVSGTEEGMTKLIAGTFNAYLSNKTLPARAAIPYLTEPWFC